MVLKNKLQRNVNWNSYIFIQEIASKMSSENVVRFASASMCQAIIWTNDVPGSILMHMCQVALMSELNYVDL